MRRQNRERWHSIDRKGLRDGGRERLRKERDATLGLTTRSEELPAEPFVALRDEERRGTEAAPAVLTDVDLVIEELLDVLDG